MIDANGDEPIEVDYYSRGEGIKRQVQHMIELGDSPFDIIVHLLHYLEETTHERGFARRNRDKMQIIYGIFLEDEKILTNEIEIVKKRLAKIQEAHKRGDLSDEEIRRAEYAIDAHKKNIKRLEALLEHATVYKEEPIIRKLPAFTDEDENEGQDEKAGDQRDAFPR